MPHRGRNGAIRRFGRDAVFDRLAGQPEALSQAGQRAIGSDPQGKAGACRGAEMPLVRLVAAEEIHGPAARRSHRSA